MGLPAKSINVSEIIENDKSLLVNLASSDHFSDEDARTVGALLVNEFFEVARRRKKDDRGRDPHPYFLFMDEFQDFVSLDLAKMLDQVRKFGLFLTMAHQRFGQLDENMVDAVLTNAKIKAVFGGLPVPSARIMAEELFIGELDPKKIKLSIYQTKFWPTYSRDKVYGKSTTHSSGSGSSQGSGSASFSGSATGESFFTGADWFGSSVPMGMSVVNSSGSTDTQSSASNYSESYATSESEVDIPIFVPVPFQELSSVTFYSPEEQLIELTAGLKEQYPRHCFIKIHHQKTQPMLVPFVNMPPTREENKQWYINEQFREQGALDSAAVDDLLKAQEAALLQRICSNNDDKTAVLLEVEPIEQRAAEKEDVEPPAPPEQPKKKKPKKTSEKKTSLRDRINKNLNLPPN